MTSTVGHGRFDAYPPSDGPFVPDDLPPCKYCGSPPLVTTGTVNGQSYVAIGCRDDKECAEKRMLHEALEKWRREHTPQPRESRRGFCKKCGDFYSDVVGHEACCKFDLRRMSYGKGD